MDLRSIPVEVHAFESHPSHFLVDYQYSRILPGFRISRTMYLNVPARKDYSLPNHDSSPLRYHKPGEYDPPMWTETPSSFKYRPK